MIDQLPEGKSIGWIQAPLDWIFSHTVRFVGIVRVVIEDGEGFILIRKGKPLVYYFKHVRIELRGTTALDFFKSRPILEFNLCKYTLDEMSRALEICNVRQDMPGTAGIPVQAPLASERETDAESDRRDESAAGLFEKDPVPGSPKKPEEGQKTTGPVADTPVPAGQIPDPVAEITSIVGKKPQQIDERTEPAAEDPGPARQAPDTTADGTSPVIEPSADPDAPVRDLAEPPVPEDPDRKIIDRIKKLNGIIAISVFNDDRNILLLGDVEIEPLLDSARSMLATANRIQPHLTWGSFVHMTLQIPDGNMILAPYHENHLCILTTRTINIGHIRRILRTLQQE